MAIQWSDIALHAVPATAVSIAMGFLAATAFNALPMPGSLLMAALATATALGFAYIWIARERKQHGGQLGGTQSKLEAFIPLICGVVTYPPAFLAFLKLDI